MKGNHVLIDYENLQPEVAETLASPVFNVWVFVGVQQAKVSFDLVNLLQTKGAAAKVIKMGGSGRNALDFHMSYYLGGLVKQHPGDYFHLLTGDTGMDPLIAHLQAQGVHVNRWRDVNDIPLLKRPAQPPRRREAFLHHRILGSARSAAASLNENAAGLNRSAVSTKA